MRKYRFFCDNILEDKLKSFETEKRFGGCSKNRKYHTRQKMRLDIFIECENDKYIVELKNPTFKRENREAVGQILAYGEYIDGAKLILVTTMYDPDTEKIIRKYNLPIRYICISKRTSYEFKEYRYL